MTPTLLPITAQAASWSSPVTVPSASLTHYASSATQDQQNNTWVFWSQGPSIYYNINYSKCQPICWSADQKFPRDNLLGVTPSALTLSNGTIMLIWSGGRPGGTTSTIYTAHCTTCTTSNTVWSTSTLLSTDQSDNSSPAAFLDLSGKLWVTWSRAESSDLRLRFVDANGNGLWDPGETVVYDTNSNGVYDSGEPVIIGSAPFSGTTTLFDPRVRYVDTNRNGRWDQTEAVVYDSDLNGVYDPKIKYVDSNNNQHWDPGESVVLDSNGNGVYDTGETILAGTTPPQATLLKSDSKIEFVDSNLNAVWDPGELVIYDSNQNNRYDSGEPVISAPLSSDPKIRFVPSPATSNVWYANETIVYDSSGNGVYDGKIKFVDSNFDGIWDDNETVVYDSILNGQYDFGEPVILGLPPAPRTNLNNDPRLRFIESDGIPGWQPGEAVIYDSNKNGLLDLGESIIAGLSPATGTALSIDKRIRYVDSNSNGIWDLGDNLTPPETAVYDTNNDTIYNSGDFVVEGAAPSLGSALSSDPGLKFVDLNSNGAWDPGEAVVYDSNLNGLHEHNEPVLLGATPAIGSSLNIDGEPVIYSQVAGVVPDPGTTLKKDPKVKFYDSNLNGVWNTGEFLGYDSNNNNLYDYGDNPVTGSPPTPVLNAALRGDEQLIVDATAPTIGTTLKTDATLKFVDANHNGSWNSGETVVWDSDLNSTYDGGEFVISGIPPPIGTSLSTDSKIMFADVDANNRWSPGEYVIYDSGTTTGKFDSGDVVIASTPTGTSIGLVNSLFYKTLTGNSWSTDLRLTASLSSDKSPAVTQTRDGKIRVFFSRNSALFYKIFDGTTWSSDAQFITPPAGDSDTDPSTTQDRDGTIWVVWTRVFPPQGNTIPTDLYYSTSTDAGSTWSAAQALTSGGNEFSPSIAQFKDKKLWIYYSTSTTNTVDLTYINALISTHNVKMYTFSASPSATRAGEIISLTSNVSNIGDFSETYQFAVKTNSSTVASNSGTLNVGQSKLVTINWDTSGTAPGIILLTANVSLTSGESFVNKADNVLTFTIHLYPKGDVNHDCVVNIIDLSSVGSTFGKRSTDPGYNAVADLNHDGVVNVVDLSIVGSTFGQKAGC